MPTKVCIDCNSNAGILHEMDDGKWICKDCVDKRREKIKRVIEVLQIAKNIGIGTSKKLIGYLNYIVEKEYHCNDTGQILEKILEI